MPKPAKTVAVCIPVYKTELHPYEVMSLIQCLTVLGKHPIIFVCGETLDVTVYEELCKGKVDFVTERFNDDYFTSIAGYNQLLLSTAFYQRFINYQYMLIYQLDAYVFKDDLDYWCSQGYDYIGAPYLFVDLDLHPIKILTTYRKLLRFLNKTGIVKYQYRHVGNGGLSLRNVKKAIGFLRIFKRLVARWELNEDSLFTHYGNLIFFYFKLAPEKDALRFAFEERPAESYIINNKQLPFGCHAFAKWNDDNFWSDIIKFQPGL